MTNQVSEDIGLELNVKIIRPAGTQWHSSGDPVVIFLLLEWTGIIKWTKLQWNSFITTGRLKRWKTWHAHPGIASCSPERQTPLFKKSLHIRTLPRNLQPGIENTNPLLKNLFILLKDCFMRILLYSLGHNQVIISSLSCSSLAYNSLIRWKNVRRAI